MKQNIFIAVAIVAIAVGCTKSNLVDAPEAQQTPISFETYTGKTPTTKAVSETTETLAKNYSSTNTAIHVNAFVPGTYTSTYESMDVYPSSYTADDPETDANEFSATWTYSGKAYWPSNGKLDFIAYGNNAADHLAAATSGSLTSFNYTVSPKVSEQEDLIVAVTPTTGSMPTDGTVSLTFKHLLSRVGFTLKTTQAHTGVSVTINSIVLKGSDFASIGTINFLDAEGALVAEPSITATADPNVTSYSLFDTTYPAETYDYFFTPDSPGPDNGIGIYPNMKHTADEEVASAISANNRYMMLIPGATVTGAEVYYQLPGAGVEHANATLTESITLEKGKAYEFIIKLSTDAIEFSGEVTDWDPVDGTDTPIPQQPEPTPEPGA